MSDFCLNDRRISAEPAPAPKPGETSVYDEGNRFDTDPTLKEILEHNEVYDALCPPVAPSS